MFCLEGVFVEFKKENMSKNIALLCRSVWYYSRTDEDLFFEWISKIPSIIKFDGVGDELYLYFDTNKISDEDLRELLAIFFRYKINMKQLAVFLNKKNQAWFFENHKAYWHRRVFGIQKKL